MSADEADASSIPETQIAVANGVSRGPQSPPSGHFPLQDRSIES